MSPDESRLYVANADNNDVAVIDISDPKESRHHGIDSHGWYPSTLIVSPDNKTLYVGVGKGMAFGPSAPDQYIAKLLNGAVEEIAIPNQAQLGIYTRQVIANTPAPERDMQLTAAQQGILKNTFPQIKHVLWIIRENRTYDQLLGDLPYGNGDPSLAMFGKDVTPNAHALAQEFTLFDNLIAPARSRRMAMSGATPPTRRTSPRKPGSAPIQDMGAMNRTRRTPHLLARRLFMGQLPQAQCDLPQLRRVRLFP